MRALSSDRTGFAQDAVVSLATLGALVLLGVVSAYWVWAWLAPRAEARAPAAQSAQLAGAVDAASGLFGAVQRERSGGGSGAARLLGVVAPSGRLAGYALLRLDAKTTIAVPQGQEIEPGVKLVEVHADHVVLERSGVPEKLLLPEKAGK
jgi:general secretion pathway protein C